MIVTRKEIMTFKPITITLECVNEALMMGEAIRAYQRQRQEHGFICMEKTPKDVIAEELITSLIGMGY